LDGSIATTRAHCREAGDKLGLADRAHLGRAAGAVHRPAFEKHGGDDVVPGIEVSAQLVNQIAMVRPIPEMMVGVDDRQFGIEDRFRRLLGQPRVVWRRYGSSELGGLPGHSDAPFMLYAGGQK